MWLLPLTRASGGGGGICPKPVLILFCLVLKATLSVSKVISLIRSTSFPSLGLLIAFAMLRCLMQQDLEGYSWNPGFDPKNRARFVKTQNFRNLLTGTEFGRYSGGRILQNHGLGCAQNWKRKRYSA